MSLNKRGVKIKNNSQCLVWPPDALSTAVHLLLMDCTIFASSCCEMSPLLFHQDTCKFPDISGGNGPSPHRPIQQVPDMLNVIEVRASRWPWQNTDIHVLQEITHRTSSMAGGIVMLEGHVRMRVHSRNNLYRFLLGSLVPARERTQRQLHN